MVTEQLVGRVSAGIAGLTCVLLYLEARGVRAPRLRRPIAVALMLASVATYFHFFELPTRSFYHRWEMYHYFLGSKYADELGFERLYTCSAVADAEDGEPARVAKRRMRDLRTDAIVSAAQALAEPEACKRHFSIARWQAFRADARFFRQQAGASGWQAMQVDHGYNPAPAWTLVGRALSSLAPASERVMRLLALIDPVLMVAALGLLLWAFGGRVAWLATVFWGTQAPSAFSWTGGAFLRQDWLFLVVLAVALLRKRYFFGAGVALAWASLLRVFPVLLFAGPGIVIAAAFWRSRGWLAAHRSFVLGSVLSAVLSLGATLSVFGARYHTEFAEHITMHADTPVANHMSLRSLLSIGQDSLIRTNSEQPNAVDPTARWANARRAHFARFRWLYWCLAALLSALFALTLWRVRSLWMALSLSLLLILLLTDPSSYYFSVWIIAAPLVLARPVLTLPLAGLAAASQLLAFQIGMMDVRFAALTALYLAFSVLMVCVFARQRFGLAGLLLESGEKPEA
ncbi:MAG: hypothetical protein ABI548_18615 [Polyangiaceae bacterium]